MSTINFPNEQDADRLYEKYGRTLEKKYTGKFVAISPQGKVLLGSTALEALEKAAKKFGVGNFVFKVGEKVVGKWL